MLSWAEAVKMISTDNENRYIFFIISLVWGKYTITFFSMIDCKVSTTYLNKNYKYLVLISFMALKD